MIKKIILSAVVASSLAVTAQADTKNDDKLVTHTELGYIKTTGNTETQTFSLDTKWKKGWEKHIFTWSFDGQYAEDNDIESKNKFFTELEYDYEITDRFAFDYLAGYKSDKFSNFDYQFYTGPGAKYKAIKSDAHNLSLEGNILYAYDMIMKEVTDASGAVVNYPYTDAQDPTYVSRDAYSDDYAGVRLKGIYEWKISDVYKFNQELSYRADISELTNYFVFSKTDLSAKMTDILSASLSYKFDYVNEPGDKKSTDNTFTIGLIIDY